MTTVFLFVVFFISFCFYLYRNYKTPILIYHSLDESEGKSSSAVTPEVFFRQMRFIKKRGYRVMLLDEYARLLKDNKSIPGNLVIITFDDGYKDNLKAIEILNNLSFPATIFLVVNEIGKKGYLSCGDISWFLKNTKVRIGSHTLNHAYLPDAKDEEIEKEIRDSKNRLQELFSQEIETFAYPVGGFDKRVLPAVENAGYLCGCTSNRGFSRELDRFTLRRIKITNRDLGVRLGVKLSGFYNLFKKPKKPH